MINWPVRLFICLLPLIFRTEQIVVADGLDLHKSFIVATILTLTGNKLINRFYRTQSGLIALKNRVVSNIVEAVGCESKSDSRSELFRLSSVLTDIFRKSGALIMKGILNDMSVGEILLLLPASVLKKEEALRDVLSTTLSESALVRLASCLRVIKTVIQEIVELTNISTNMTQIISPGNMKYSNKFLASEALLQLDFL